jgi:hypothetical protein
MTNPLLDFSDLPRFDQIRPEHVAPAMDDLLASARAHSRPSPRPISPRSGPRLPPCWTLPPSAWAAPGARSPPQQRGRHARVARRLQRCAAQSHRILDPPGCRRAPLCQVQGHRPGPAERRAAPGPPQCPAQLRARWRRADRAPPGSALPRSRSARPNWRRNSAKTRSTPPTPSATCHRGELDGVPTDVKQTARAAPPLKARTATSSRSRCRATCR